MVKRIFSFISALLIAFFIISCGETDCDDEGCGEIIEDEQTEYAPEMTLRIISDTCAAETINSASIDKLGSLAITINNFKGELEFKKSFTKSEISSGMKVSGIPDVDNATVILSGFGADPNVVKWSGKVIGLTFKKGKKTSISAVLYPTSGQSCFPFPLKNPRFGHTATLLPDGRILVTGGFGICSASKCVANKSVEIIDVESGTVETLADMFEERAMHEAVLLSDASVMIFGGVRALDIGTKNYDDYPALPYTFSIQATSVERYMPQYPKLNMRDNNIGIPVENITQNMNLQYTATGMPFLPMQSYYVDSSVENRKTIYLVGGTDTSGVPTNKVYAFDVFETAEGITLSASREIAPVDKDKILMPAVGSFGGSLFSAGGRIKEPVSVASFYTADSSTAWEGTGPNLFYTKGIMVDNNLYTFGGLENKGEDALANNLKGYKWSIGEKTSSATTNNLLTYGSSLFFADAVYHEAKGNFIVVGGAGGSKTDISQGNNLYQVISKSTFSVFKEPLSYVTKYKRILPRAVIIPGGTVTNDDTIFITGGTTAIGSSGVAVEVIEINNLK